MKDNKFLYIPFAIIFLFSMSVLVIHYSNISRFVKFEPRPYQIPFSYFNGVLNLKDAGRKAGLEVGDKIIKIDGVPLKEHKDIFTDRNGITSTNPIVFEIERKIAEGKFETKEVTITPVKTEKNLEFYFSLFLNFAFLYLLPTFCILLGLWVVFVRPHDYLAWLLYFLLSGLSTISLEPYQTNILVSFYRSFFSNTWALSMLLFGIYFPERWSVDKKIPWAKWIFIVPLVVQFFLMVIGNLNKVLNINIIDVKKLFSNDAVSSTVGFINIIATGLFFAALSHKATSLKNSDSRRRLKLMAVGTIAAMFPTFSIILYRMFSGAKGSFFDVVPPWYAIMALLMLLLFPITMAYVIVVQRAMNVSVVVRQGLQYALAKNGVLILQILLSIAVILTALSFISDNTTNRLQKILFIALGVAFVFLIGRLAGKIKTWVDRKFFREAYNAEQI